MAAFAARDVQQVPVQGTVVSATDVGHYATGDRPISDLTLSQPARIRFPRGNSFTAKTQIFLYENGNVSMIVSDSAQTLNWTAIDGRKYTLDCSPRSGVDGMTNRLVRFYPDGEYHDGCALSDPTELKATNDTNVTVSGDVEVDSQFRLIYVQHFESAVVQVGGVGLKTVPGTSLAFYPDGQINFLTLERGQSYVQDKSPYGPLRFLSPMTAPATLTFFPDGQVERGLLGSTIPAAALRPEAPSGSGVEFSETGEVIHIILRQPAAFRLGTYDLSIREWDRQGASVRVAIASDLKIRPPGRDEDLDVPAGSVMTFGSDGELVQVQVPEKVAADF